MKIAAFSLEALLLVFVLTGWGCGKKEDQGLSVSMNPNNPILIPISQSVGGIQSGPTAPYINFQSMTLTWTGTARFEFLALEVFATNQSNSSSNSSTSSPPQFYNCGGSGVDLISSLYGGITYKDCGIDATGASEGAPTTHTAIDAATGNLILNPAAPGCSITVVSNQFPCDSLPITISSNPFASYNVPVTILVFGQGLNTATGNTTGRIAAIGNITIH